MGLLESEHRLYNQDYSNTRGVYYYVKIAEKNFKTKQFLL